MITVKITWWLWNQMFQYALWKHLAIKNNTELVLDISWFQTYKLHKYCLHIFGIQDRIASQKEIPRYNKQYKNKYLSFLRSKFTWLVKYYIPHHIEEKQFNFDPTILHTKNNHYLEWYWQTDKYFSDIEQIIRDAFVVTLAPSKQNQNTLRQIIGTNSVSLHIRRGDYVSSAINQRIYGTCDLDYYERAIKIISTKVSDPIFYIFSDDIDWAKKHLQSEGQYIFVDWNNAETNYEDLRLMYHCKHNIIANSSFSWWGAWLNQNPHKLVIAPAKRFNNDMYDWSDIVPTSWIKI